MKYYESLAQWRKKAVLDNVMDGVAVRLSQSTVEQYSVYISRFLDFLENTGGSVSDWDTPAFLELCRYKKWNLTNMKNALRSFGVPFPTVRYEPKKRKKVFLSLQDILKILAVCEGEERHLLSLLACSGLRISEVYWLRYSDIQFSDILELHIQKTKRKGERRAILLPHFPFSHSCGRFLSSNLTSAYIFRRYWDTVQKMKDTIKKISQRSGVRFSAHSFRHFFARTLLEMDCPLTTIQQLLGHESIKTTLTYIETNFDLAVSTLSKRLKSYNSNMLYFQK